MSCETTHINLQVEVDKYCSVAKLDKGISSLLNYLKISSHVIHNSLTLQLSSSGWVLYWYIFYAGHNKFVWTPSVHLPFMTHTVSYIYAWWEDVHHSASTFKLILWCMYYHVLTVLQCTFIYFTHISQDTISFPGSGWVILSPHHSYSQNWLLEIKPSLFILEFVLLGWVLQYTLTSANLTRCL